MGRRTASMQELLSAHFDYAMADVYTSMPGVVVAVRDMGEMYVDVQPSLNMRTENEEIVSSRPPIMNVPLQLPISTKGGLTFPVSVGDPVWLMFSMRGLDTWKRSSGVSVTPSDMRKFDIRDCCAIPGTYPMGSSPNSAGKRSNAHSPDDVVLVHNIGGSETEIRLKPSGDIEINSPTNVKIKCVSASIESDSTNIDTGNMTVNSDSFVVNSGTVAISATTSAEMNASFNMTGSFVLNGTAVEDHTHGGVLVGDSRTGEFGE